MQRLFSIIMILYKIQQGSITEYTEQPWARALVGWVLLLISYSTLKTPYGETQQICVAHDVVHPPPAFPRAPLPKQSLEISKG